MESFCNSYFAIWFSDWGACNESPNPIAVALIEKAIEQARSLPMSIFVCANCPNRCEDYIAMKAAIILIDSGVSIDGEGNPVTNPPDNDRRYVKRDKVGYVEREYERWEPNCDDCESGIASLRTQIAQIEEYCQSPSTAVGGTNYGCVPVDPGCCGHGWQS